uniref:Uncharacterized protein n=1 Tax=Oryza nivara TaxID=4536 RepID=A0A0E0IDR5_ORYNI
MDRREGRRKRAREEEAAAVFEEVTSSSSSAAAATAAVVGGGDKGKEEEEGEGWKRPPGVFEFPWQKCRGGLGVPVGGGGGGGGGGSWELRDVFFRSLVDGRAAAIGFPGDRLFPPPSKRALFDDVDAWLAAAGEGEVDPVWRSVLEEGPRPVA